MSRLWKIIFSPISPCVLRTYGVPKKIESVPVILFLTYRVESGKIVNMVSRS